MLGVQFTLDCACNESGSNALCPAFLSLTGQNYFETDLSGETNWINPPFSEIEKWVQHYIECKRSDPVNTSACFVIPKWASAVQLMQQSGFELVKEYPTDTVLFSAPNADGSRHVMPGIPWPVQVYYDAPEQKVVLRSMGNDSRESYIMTLKGILSTTAVKIMLDSGAACAGKAHGFITKDALHRCTLAMTNSTIRWVNLASGNNSPILGEVTTSLRVGQFKQKKLKLFVIASGIAGVDVILGADWMRKNNATLCWDSNTVTLRNPHAQTVLHPEYARSDKTDNLAALHIATAVLNAVTTPDTLSARQAYNLIKKGARAFFLVINQEGEIAATANGVQLAAAVAGWNQKLVPELQMENLKREFKTIFDDVGHYDTLPDMGNGGEHPITLDPNEKYKGFKRMYRLSPRELEEIKKQVAHLLSLGMIEPSNSPYGAPVLFVDKPDGSLRMCIDYRALNKITVKDRYPMPNIQDLFDQLQGASVFSTLDLQSGYYQIRICEEDRPKTAFLTPMGQFQFKVMCFGLANAPATFQRRMNAIFGERIGKFVLVYLDDIMVFSKNPEDHVKHLREVFSILQKYNMKAKLSKCQFNKPELKFLGHIIGKDGLKVDPEKVRTVQEWPQPDNPKKLRSFLGLANYFRRFIRDYSSIAAPLTKLTGSKVQWDWTLACTEAFQQIKFALTHAPVLQLPDPKKPYVVWSDASIVGTGAVLLQEGKPVAYTSRKLSPAEVNYSTTDQECLGIVTALREWRCYLEGAVGLEIWTDHHPLIYLQSQSRDNILSRRQARWMEELTRFNFTIQYKKGKDNIADPLSRIYDSAPLLASIHLSIANALRDKLLQGYKQDKNFVANAKRRNYTLRDGLFYDKRDRIIVPEVDSLRLHILAQYHDHAMSGHRGAIRMQEAVTRTFTWYGITKDVAQYVASCPSCQRNKASTSKPAGLLQPLKTPMRPWGSVSMDFIGPLPNTEPDGSGYNAILVIVDRLTKMCRLCATTTKCTAKDVADLIIKHVFCNGHGLPDDFVSDRDTRFTSDFWKELMQHFQVRLRMSSAFHPQTDGQTERMNRLVEETLRHYINPTQSDWHEHLPMVEFAINDSLNASIGTTPFKLNYTWDIKLPNDDALRTKLFQAQSADRKANKAQGLPFKCDAAAQYASEMHKRLTRAKELLCAAQNRQKQYADKKRKQVTYAVGDWVMLDTRNLKFQRTESAEDTKKQRGKLMPRFIGPYQVKELHGPVAVNLALPKNLGKIHPVFHISLVKPFTVRKGTKPTAPPPILLDEDVYYELEKVVNHKLIKRGNKVVRREFYIQWKGYEPEYNTWEKETELREQDLVSKEIDAYCKANGLPKRV